MACLCVDKHLSLCSQRFLLMENKHRVQETLDTSREFLISLFSWETSVATFRLIYRWVVSWIYIVQFFFRVQSSLKTPRVLLACGTSDKSLVEGSECLRNSLPSKLLLKEKFRVIFIISDINHIKLVLARNIHNWVLCCALWLLLLLMMTLFSTLLFFPPAISKSFCSLGWEL